MKLVHIGLDVSFSAPNPNIEDSASHEIGEEESPKSAENVLMIEKLSNSGVIDASLATFFGFFAVLIFLLV